MSALLLGVILLDASLLAGQTAAGIGRTADGRPNLNGIWQIFSTANQNLQDHPAYAGPMWELGANQAVRHQPRVRRTA